MSESTCRRLVTLCVALIWYGLTSCLVSGESQWWLEGNATLPLAKEYKFNAGIQSRLDSSGSLVREQTTVGVAYTGLAAWFDVGMSYRTIFRRLVDEEWIQENRAFLDGIARFKLFKLAFSNRIRLEYNNPDSLSEFGTFRNKLSLNPPYYLEPTREGGVGWRYFNLRPFASYEFFYSTNKDIISRYRIEGGVSYLFSERVFCDIYYLYQVNDMETAGPKQKAFGVNLKLLF